MLLTHARPRASAALHLRLRCYHSPSFSFPGAGFSGSIESSEPILGPLAKAKAGGVTITPRTLKQHLDRFVVGQDKSKRVLSTAIYHHYQRIQQQRDRQALREAEAREREREVVRQLARENLKEGKEGGFEGDGTLKTVTYNDTPRVWEDRSLNPFEQEEELVIEKSNVLCLGPTGVGKTLMVRTLAKILDVPFSMSDCTPFTMAGYVGEDVDQSVHRLLQASNYDVDRAQTGIICLDEFDKLAKPKAMHGGTKDISGEGVQQALLKIIEGTTLQIQTKQSRPPPHTPHLPPNLVGAQTPQKGDTVTIDTSGILFIFTGAFIGLDKIISDRLGKGAIGFSTSSDEAPKKKEQKKEELLEKLEPKDLISFGLIPEIVGRIPITTATHLLSPQDLIRILTEPSNALLKQYTHLFSLSGITLHFTSPALHAIADSALKMGTGARGLRTVVEGILSDAMFETPGSSVKYVVVTEEVAKGKIPSLYFGRGERVRMRGVVEAEEEAWVKRGNKSYVDPPRNEEEDLEIPGTPPTDVGQAAVAVGGGGA